MESKSEFTKTLRFNLYSSERQSKKLVFKNDDNLSGKKPKLFLYVWNYLEWGGAQVLFFGLMKEAKKHGKVIAVLPNGSHPQLLKFLDNLGVEQRFFEAHADVKPAASMRRKIERHWNKIHSEIVLLRYLRKIDLRDAVIHSELAPWQSSAALLWMCRRATVFVTMHNAIPPVPDRRFRWWKKKFAMLTKSANFNLFTANYDTKKSLAPLVSKEFLETVKVTYANVNPDEIERALSAPFERAAMLKKYGLPENKFLVFCVGQFIDRKGRWIFLEAAQKLAAEHEDIAFVWISNYKPDASELEKAASYGLGANFVFLSSDQVGAEHIDLFVLLRLADVFALPSYLEGLPISIIEAMALGIPTISTNINAIPEAIIHLKTGILIEPGDGEALRRAISVLKSDVDLRRELSVKGRAYALEKFDQHAVAKIAVESYIEAYRRGK